MDWTISYLPDLIFIFITIVCVLIRAFILLVDFICVPAGLLVLIFPFSNFGNFRLLFLALPQEIVVEE